MQKTHHGSFSCGQRFGVSKANQRRKVSLSLSKGEGRGEGLGAEARKLLGVEKQLRRQSLLASPPRAL
jgi:hypothetical protein